MDLAEFVTIIRRWKWLVLALVVVVTGAAVYTATRSNDSYRAEATIVIGLSGISSLTDSDINVVRSGGEIGATYAELITVRDVLSKALDTAGLDWNPDTLKGMVTPDVSPEAPIVRVIVTDSDPQRAVLLANSVAEAFVDYIDKVQMDENEATKDAILEEITGLEEQIAAGVVQGSGVSQAEINALERQRVAALESYQELLAQQEGTGNIEVIETADSASTVGVNKTQTIAIGFLISLVAGIIFAFIAEGIRKSYQNED